MPMEHSAEQQLSPLRERQQGLGIKRVWKGGTRRVASIIVLGLLVVGTILNLDWYINSMQDRDNVSFVPTTISSSQTQQIQDSQNERAYTKPVEKIVLLGESK